MIGCCWLCVGNNGWLNVGWQQWPVVTDCLYSGGDVVHATFICATMVAGLSLCLVTNCFILFSRTIKKV